MNIKSEMLIESKSLRETVIDRVDVLDKVKKLSMLTGDIYVTIEMVANYYEVDRSVIDMTISRNRTEFTSDGLKVLRGDELTNAKLVTSIPKRTPSLTVLNRRSVLRVGMILQDSEVARTVRSYLLDKEEEKPKEQFEVQIPNSIEDLIILQAKSVKELKTEVAILKANQAKTEEAVTALAEGMMYVPDSAIVIKNVNELARWTRIDHSELYNKSYDILKQRHGHDIKRRMENERERIQKDYEERTGKRYAESTLKQKVNGIDIMTREGCLGEFNEIIFAQLSAAKARSQIKVIKN